MLYILNNDTLVPVDYVKILRYMGILRYIRYSWVA